MINNSLLELILNDICTTFITWNKMFLYFQYPSDHAFVCVWGGGGFFERYGIGITLGTPVLKTNSPFKTANDSILSHVVSLSDRALSHGT